MDIGQGAGVASATGVRPFLPPLLAGALARGDNGIDFDGSKYHFLESTWFLLLVLVLAVAAYLLERRGERDTRLLERVLLAAAVVLGALLFAGSLAGNDETSWWGILAGAGCAVLGFAAVAALFARARRRVTGGAAALVEAYADAVALGVAGLAIAFSPLGYVALVAFALLALRSRGQAGQKYEGLRILR